MSKLDSTGLTVMGQWLRSISRFLYHFYAVNLSEDDPNSLAHLIGVSKQELDAFILATGLGMFN